MALTWDDALQAYAHKHADTLARMVERHQTRAIFSVNDLRDSDAELARR